MRFHPIVIAGLVLLAGMLGVSQPPVRTVPDPGQTLVVPIYPWTLGYDTNITVLEVSGEFTKFEVREFDETGRYVPGERLERSVGRYATETITFHPLYYGWTVGNGWALLTYPSDRELHAFSTITHYRNDDFYTSTSARAVKPAKGFRLYGFRWSDQETAVSIVNPTDEEQTVTVRIYRIRPTGSTLANTWNIGPMHRMSRFLSELVVLEDRVEDFSGVVQIQGEADIAVGALTFSHETGQFWSQPVWSQPVRTEPQDTQVGSDASRSSNW